MLPPPCIPSFDTPKLNLSVSWKERRRVSFMIPLSHSSLPLRAHPCQTSPGCRCPFCVGTFNTWFLTDLYLTSRPHRHSDGTDWELSPCFLGSVFLSPIRSTSTPDSEELGDVFLSSPFLRSKSLVLSLSVHSTPAFLKSPLSFPPSPLAKTGHHSLPELAFFVPFCLFLWFSKGKKVTFLRFEMEPR